MPSDHITMSIMGAVRGHIQIVGSPWRGMIQNRAFRVYFGALTFTVLSAFAAGNRQKWSNQEPQGLVTRQGRFGSFFHKGECTELFYFPYSPVICYSTILKPSDIVSFTFDLTSSTFHLLLLTFYLQPSTCPPPTSYFSTPHLWQFNIPTSIDTPEGSGVTWSRRGRRGACATAVAQGSHGAIAGIREGDLVLAIDGVSVDGLQCVPCHRLEPFTTQPLVPYTLSEPVLSEAVFFLKAILLKSAARSNQQNA
jgi:hypothetical protein